MGSKHNQLPTVVFVANRGFALISSRLLLMQHFLSNGWRVIAATAPDEYTEKLSKMGLNIEPVTFNRGGVAYRADIKALLDLVQIYRRYRPQLIHHFHAKPIILGTLASYLINQTKIINTITGLGHAFIHGGPTRTLAATGYRWLLSKSAATIFQNPDDQALFIEHGWIPDHKTRLIVSSGVDTRLFSPNNTGQKKCVRVKVLMVARLLWEKGVREFIEAAEIVLHTHPKALFQLAGEWDPIHPDAVDKAWIQTKIDQEVIQFLGYLNNISEYLPTVDLIALPSYREGTPRILLEAAACGIPVITTDTPGCRETIIDSETGFLVPPKNSQALAEAICKLIDNPTLRNQMGFAGRKLIEEEFDIRMVTKRYLSVYREIGIEI